MTSSFFFNDTATTEIYTLSLHDALPIHRPDFLKRVVPQARLLDALVLQLQFADEIRVMDEKDWTPVRLFGPGHHFEQPLGRFEFFRVMPEFPRRHDFQRHVAGAADLQQ